MSIATRLRRRLDEARSGERSDAGMTLIELIVAMGLFTILLGIFMSGVATMTNVTVRTQAASDSSDEARRAYQRLDKEVRYAAAVNRPGIVGGNEYIEFQTTAVDVGDNVVCTQWKLNASTDRLQYRTWPDVTGATATAWVTAANRVMNNPTTSPVFTFHASDGTHSMQRVDVYIDVQSKQGDGAEVRSSFVALNTTPTTQTNEAAGSASKYPVCQQVARS